MASAYKCDICQNYYGDNGFCAPKYCICKSNGLIKPGVRLDLCPDCSDLLAAWVHGKAILMSTNAEDIPECVSRLEYPADEVDDE